MFAAVPLVTLTPEQEAFIPKAIAQGKQEILDDIESGIHAHDVDNFSALHDHCDANCYGGLCDDKEMDRLFPGYFESEREADALCEVANRVQSALDAWLEAGRPMGDTQA